jgi:hypothetical protein
VAILDEHGIGIVNDAVVVQVSLGRVHIRKVETTDALAAVITHPISPAIAHLEGRAVAMPTARIDTLSTSLEHNTCRQGANCH